MWSEFKEFISKGNVMDLAVGVVIGAAFGKIVSSIVDDILMPPIGKLLAGVDFKSLQWVIGSKVAEDGKVSAQLPGQPAGGAHRLHLSRKEACTKLAGQRVGTHTGWSLLGFLTSNSR